MARITVEDCLENIDNIFEMVLVAAKRARRIAHGADPMVELENDKPTVLALREIADGLRPRADRVVLVANKVEAEEQEIAGDDQCLDIGVRTIVNIKIRTEPRAEIFAG